MSRYIYRLIQHTASGDVELLHGDQYIDTPIPSQGGRTNAEDVETASFEPKDYMFIAALYSASSASEILFLPNLSKDRRLDNLARFVNFGAVGSNPPPSSLAEYQNISIVLALQDRYSEYTPLQFNALRDYVRGGGLLVICGAKPSQALYNSPLRGMLPVIPDGVCHLDDGNALRKAWGFPPREYAWRDENGDLAKVPGYDFQEVIVPEDSTILSTMDGRPMMVLRQYGLGMVLWTAFDPMEFAYYEPETSIPLWNSILRHASFVSLSRRPDSQLLLENIQNQLLGYSIPPFRTLGFYLLAYVLGAAILLAVFTRIHRPATGWGMICLLGIIMTFVIVIHAHNLSANQPDRQLNTVTIAVWDGAPGPSIHYANLASRSDISLDLQLDGATGFLFPRAEKTSVDSATTALEQNRLLVNADADTIALNRLSLQENRPRAANWQLASRELETPQKAELPTLEIAADGAMRLLEWNVPDTLCPFNRALLMLPGAMKTLSNSDTSLTGIADNAVENDTVLVQVREFLSARLLRVPAVCLVSILRKDTPGEECKIVCQGGDFSTYEYRITLIPLHLSWPTTGDTFTVPPELTWMSLDMNSTLARYWKHGKCTGLLFSATYSASDEQRYSRRNRVPVNVELPFCIPSGTLCGANIHHGLVENSTSSDVQVCLFDQKTDQPIEPLSSSPQNSQFGEESAKAFDAANARLAVNFIPVSTSAQDDIQENAHSTREQTWWVNQVQATLVFRRNSVPSPSAAP